MKKKLIRRLKKTKAGAWIIKKIRAHRRDKMCLELSKNAVVKEKQIIFSAFCNKTLIFQANIRHNFHKVSRF